MKNINFATFTIFISLTLSLVASSVPELDRYKSIYQKELKRLTATSQTQRLFVPQNHIKAMKKLEMEYQQSGDLKNLLAVRKERKRFIGDPRVHAIIPVATPTKLRALQESYIANYDSIKENRTQGIDELKEKYIAVLKNLQTTLTKQGKIDEALVVMNEIESSDSTSGSFSTDFVPYVEAPNSGQAPKTLNKDTLGTLVHGKVVRWNSYNNQITIHYDFSDSNQMLDWKGGEIDRLRKTLVCKNSVAWLTLQMEDISNIECDMSFQQSDNQAGIVVGNSLTALLTGGRPTTARIYQSSPQNPVLVVRDIENYTGNKYHSLITLNSKQVSWSINGGGARRGIMNNSIIYPTFIGFGHVTSSSSYDNITITATLSKKQLERFKQQL